MTPFRKTKKKAYFGILFFLLLVLIAVLTFFVVYLLLNRSFEAPSNQKTIGSPDINEKTFYAPEKKIQFKDDGLFENIEQTIPLQAPIAVVIENHFEARPQQSGLAEADIVYETVAEAGITRFLAIYEHNRPAEIGPVRSARPYFVDWADEYGGAFVHVGGSPEALKRLENDPVLLNIDERADISVIQRNYKYTAPHNAFTSLDRILEHMKLLDFKRPSRTPRFTFKLPSETQGNIHMIAIDFFSPLYAVKYLYNNQDRIYERFVGGAKHQNISPANVIVQFTEQKVIDELLRVSIQTQGTGRAIIFRNGKAVHGSWQKDEGGVTQFYDENGKPVVLAQGQTWIEVVSTETPVNYF